MPEPILRDEWLAELERLQAPVIDDGGWSAKELQALWGCGTDKTRGRLQALNAAGRLVVGKRNITRIDGTVQRIPVYRLKPTTTEKASGT